MTRDGPHLARGVRRLRGDAPDDRSRRADRLRDARTTPSLVGAAAIQDWVGIPARATVGSEFRYSPPPIDERDARDRRHPVRRDGRHDRPDPPRPRARLPGHRRHEHGRPRDHPRGGRILFLQAGPEIAVAASKTFVTQVTTLVILAAAIARARGALRRRARAGARRRAARAARQPPQRALDERPRAIGDARPTLRQLARLHVRRPRLRRTRPRSRARSSSRRSATSTPRATRPASSSTARSRCSTPSARWWPSRRARRSTTS